MVTVLWQKEAILAASGDDPVPCAAHSQACLVAASLALPMESCDCLCTLLFFLSHCIEVYFMSTSYFFSNTEKNVCVVIICSTLKDRPRVMVSLKFFGSL